MAATMLALILSVCCVLAHAQTYNYVVVGGGMAGCIVASRLSEDPSVSVLLLEAGLPSQFALGGTDFLGRNITRFDMPSAAYTAWSYYDDYFWDIPNINVAKVLGGGGSVNGMRFVRGMKYNFDAWNVTGWDWKQMLNYYIKIENNTRFKSEIHGTKGPIQVSDAEYISQGSRLFVESAHNSGLPIIEDFNADPNSRFGAGFYQYNIRNGIRDSSGIAYLLPALKRPNFTLKTRCLATKILFEGTRAVGVEYRENWDKSKTIKAYAKTDVVVTAGAVHSAKLLLLSGIGNKTELAKFPDIQIVANVPGVGVHMQDHPQILYTWDVTRYSEPALSSMWGWFNQYNADRSGYLAAIDSSGAFMRSPYRPDLPANVPDVQIEFEDGVTCHLYSCQPSTVSGSVKLNSSDPLVPPNVVDPATNPDIDDADIKSMAWAVDVTQKILSTAPIKDYIGNRTQPPPSVNTFEKQVQYVRENVRSGNHFVGTLRMGSLSNPNVVVDEQLRVRGVQGLRVADASIMPFITHANLEATVMAMAEKAADVIKATK